MSCNNAYYGRDKQPDVQCMPNLFGHQEKYTNAKNKEWKKTVMMPAKTVT